MRHCMPKMIQQIKKIKAMKVMTEHVFKIINCIICAVSKMYEIIKNGFSDRIIKFFQMLHFDLIINNIKF